MYMYSYITGVLQPVFCFCAGLYESCILYLTYSSTISVAISSRVYDVRAHSLSSMSSVVGCGSCLQNQGGLLKLQQVLVGPHPAPSQSGSSG